MVEAPEGSVPRDMKAYELLVSFPARLQKEQRGGLWSLDPDVAFPAVDHLAEAQG